MSLEKKIPRMVMIRMPGYLQTTLVRCQRQLQYPCQAPQAYQSFLQEAQISSLWNEILSITGCLNCHHCVSQNARWCSSPSPWQDRITAPPCQDASCTKMSRLSRNRQDKCQNLLQIFASRREDTCTHRLISFFQDSEFSIKEWKTPVVHLCSENWGAQVAQFKHHEKKGVNTHEGGGAESARSEDTSAI